MKKLFVLVMIFYSASTLAGPARPIPSSAFTAQAPCGPAHDPLALEGQWFVDSASSSTNVNAWEYHDDDDSLTIEGIVQNISYGANSNITAFSVLAVVSNSLPADYQGGTATNSHGETQTPAGVSSGPKTMEEVRITAEFALANINMTPPAGSAPPYWPDPVSGGAYYIEAVNEDEQAWYCWTPGDPQNTPAGTYQVPAWKLSPFTIPAGGTASVLMQFTITGAGMPIADYRHSVIRASKQLGLDLLYNRHTSLKVSHWLDTLLIDNGTTISTPPPPWWEGDEIEYIYASDASVFYNTTEDEETHKMHHPQFPDPNGWDVRACLSGQDGLRKVLADDFLCTESGAITNITFWGSWFGDEFEQDPWQGITNIHLSIHSDIPDLDGPGPEYSKPELPALQEWDIDPQNLPPEWGVEIIPEQPSLQGWYDPNSGEFFPENHTNYYRYNITVPLNEAFIQTSNTIYWLDVSMETVSGLWGWKTTTNHWNDDAVWADLPVQDIGQWIELYEPPLFSNSLDLAFIIDGAPVLDWGDAPDPTYPTLSASGGANHIIVPGMYLGAGIDADPDGLPNSNATGDDQNINGLGGIPHPPGDEDGVSISQMTVGLPATITVSASMPGALDAWIDFNGDGDWNDPGEQVFAAAALSVGVNNLGITVPTGTTPTLSTFARFRYSTTGGFSPSGPAPDGEVEDYEVDIDDPVDWGDAPDPTYPTLAANSGASHLIGGPYLGALVDPELDGQPNATAMGDDVDLLGPSLGDDENGIWFPLPFIPGAVAPANITLRGAASALLDAWIDFNSDGDWSDPGEQVFSSYVISAGANNLYIPVPIAAVASNTYARFRVSTAGGLPPSGPAQDGEVEDHMITILEAEPLDWGDAPAAYSTLLANNGAHHVTGSSLLLGTTVDSEPDGQPGVNADGDDLNTLYSGITYPPGDEDGVTLTCAAIIPGGYASVDIIASQTGILDAWMDFNADGWAQPGDRIFSGQLLTPGTNSLIFPVPVTATNGPGYSRFRFTSSGVSSWSGLALDGEVEDYEFLISDIDSGNDWGDAPDGPYPTLASSLGANHTISAGVMLGATIDAEADGQPSINATQDDATGLTDEDGITFSSKIVSGTNATLNVVAGVSGGLLDAWIDFDSDGTWNHPTEHLWGGTAQSLSPGANSLIFAVPNQPTLQLGSSFARFRVSSAGNLPPDNVGISTPDGEVEDYHIELYQASPTTLSDTNITITVSNALVTVGWHAENNISYQLLSSTNLLTNVWTEVGGLILGPVNWQTNSADSDVQFYRVATPWTE